MGQARRCGSDATRQAGEDRAPQTSGSARRARRYPPRRYPQAGHRRPVLLTRSITIACHCRRQSALLQRHQTRRSEPAATLSGSRSRFSGGCPPRRGRAVRWRAAVHEERGRGGCDRRSRRPSVAAHTPGSPCRRLSARSARPGTRARTGYSATTPCGARAARSCMARVDGCTLGATRASGRGATRRATDGRRRRRTEHGLIARAA